MGGAHRFATALVGKARALFHGLGLTATIACAYAGIAVFTFGHAAAQNHHTGTAEYAQCRAEVKAENRVLCFDHRTVDATFTGVFSSLLWPLYWSWELQQ